MITEKQHANCKKERCIVLAIVKGRGKSEQTQAQVLLIMIKYIYHNPYQDTATLHK
jgi:hypothetical protein